MAADAVIGAIMLVAVLIEAGIRRNGRRPVNVERRLARYLRAGCLPRAAYRQAMEDLAHRPMRTGAPR